MFDIQERVFNTLYLHWEGRYEKNVSQMLTDWLSCLGCLSKLINKFNSTGQITTITKNVNDKFIQLIKILNSLQCP